VDTAGGELGGAQLAEPVVEGLHTLDGELPGEVVLGGGADVAEAVVGDVSAVAHRAREAGLEEEKRGGGLGGDAALVAAEEGLVGRAGAHQRQPEGGLDLLMGLGRGERLVEVVVHVEQASGLPQPLEHDPEPDEIEGHVVEHRAAHQAEQELGLAADCSVELVALAVEVGAGPVAAEPQVELVAVLPDLDGQGLADGAGVLAGGADDAAERAGVLLVPGDVALDDVAVGGHVGAEALVEGGLFAADDEQGLPALAGPQGAVEGQIAGGGQRPGGALGALEVAPEPEAMLCHARDHDVTSDWTQVSFEPPPWLLLTTYEPSTRATRVSPPGSTHEPEGPVRM